MKDNIFTPFLRRSVAFAVQVHEIDSKQKRKGKDVPYLIHPLTVGLILAKGGASEAVVAAGILHDTIEDSVPEHKVTRQMIEERFGPEVAMLVVSVTEDDKGLPREERKRLAIEHIRTYSENSLLLKSADTIANVFELSDDYAREGDATFLRFGVPKEQVVGGYRRIISALLKRWGGNPFAADLESADSMLEKMQ